MKIKKMTAGMIVSMLTLPISVALAGGPEYLPTPQYAGFYLEADLGYVNLDWGSYALAPLNFGPGATNRSDVSGGFTAGADLGYQFNKYWSLEWGWFYLPRVSGTSAGVAATATAWSTYGDAKMTLPIYHNLFLFGKMGGVYRDTTLTANTPAVFNGTVLPITGQYWAPLFAAGAQYYFTDNWSIHAQYMRMPGYHEGIGPGSNNRLDVPPANLYTVGAAYKFLI